MRKRKSILKPMGIMATCLIMLNGLTSTSSSTDHKISISNFTFSPSVLNIKVGDSVIFVNEDNVPHTATHITMQKEMRVFDTKSLDQLQKGKITLNNTGNYTYNCSIHPTMEGKIVVRK